MAKTPAAGSGRLLAAATEAFAERGFHGTSTRDISARAGLSPAAMYTHHRSKEELLYAISLDGHERVLRALHEAAAQGVTPTERLAGVALAFGVWHAEGHVRARVVNYELDALDADHLAEVMRLRKGIDTVFRSIVAAGVTAGEFTVADVPLTAGSLVSLGVDISRWYRPDGSRSAERVAAHYRDMALRIVGADPLPPVG
ncbi:MAG: TetR/AcrR family transcriptional regulator [Mobilicoccus sp.]|nr:TetR/AcrR family transcriptional regulator [Mobilicoccus sp.]